MTHTSRNCSEVRTTLAETGIARQTGAGATCRNTCSPARLIRQGARILAVALVIGCDRGGQNWLAKIPEADGPLRLHITYPSTLYLGAGPSTILGTTGNAKTHLMIDGRIAHVAPNGAFAAVIPGDALVGRSHHDVVAILGSDTAWTRLPVANAQPLQQDFANGIEISPAETAAASAHDTMIVHLQVPRGRRAWIGTRHRAYAEAPMTAAPPMGSTSNSGAASALLAMRMSELAEAESAFVSRGIDTISIPLPYRRLLSHRGVAARRAVAHVAIPDDSTDDPTNTILLPGAPLRVLAQRDDSLLIPTSTRTNAWIPAGATTLAEPPRGATDHRRRHLAVQLPVDQARTTEVRLITTGVPILRVEEEPERLLVRLYDPGGLVVTPTSQPLRTARVSVSMTPGDGDEGVLLIALHTPIQGFEVDTGGGTLILRLRYPPMNRRDWRVVIDPGHPPNGTTGPAGTRESDITLAVATRLQSMLSQRGVYVTLTRRDERPLSLSQRVAFAASQHADLVLSLHLDAAADGTDPYARNGTTTYYLHAHAESFADSIQSVLTRRLGTPDRGVYMRDLALTRPSASTAVLCELATLTVPEYEYLLGTPAFQSAAAEALAEGIVSYMTAAEAAPPSIK